MTFDSEDNEFLKNEESSLNLKLILPKILRIWPWILASLLIFVGIAFYLTETTSPMYRVSSKFFIKENEKGLALFENPAISQEQGIGLNNEMIILSSRPIAEATLRKLDFQVEYYEKETFRDKEIYRKTPVVVEVDWKSPQLLNGKINVDWSSLNEYQISFPE